MKRKATAVWEGDLKNGRGRISTESRVLKDTQYSFQTRFENGFGTNPEELIAAAHAACFSMALSNELGSQDIKTQKIETTAAVQLEKREGGWSVSTVHLNTQVTAPGSDQTAIRAGAEKAKINCPISKLLKAEITMEVMVL